MFSKKTTLFAASVDFLGHNTSATGIRPNQEKTKKMNDWPRPSTSTQMCAFLGLVRYLAPFLPNLADFTNTLTPFTTKAAGKLATFEKDGYGHLPICMAKTQYSFSTDPTLMGAPEGHIVGVRDVRLSAGAGFVVAICGEIMTMPGLPRVPAADTIRLDANGQIDGLF